MTVRWTCKAGHPGVLGPRRMRLRDWRRVCVPCSEAAGVIVERTAPAVERERSARREAGLAKTRRQREATARRKATAAERSAAAKAERLAARHAVAGDLRLELERLWPIAVRLSGRDDLPSSPPKLVQRRRSDEHVTGRAWPHRHRIVVSVGDKSDVAAAQGTLAHEVVHIVQPLEDHGTRGTAWHSPAFWRLLEALVAEAYSATVTFHLYAADKYGRQQAVEAAVRNARA